MPKVKTVTPAAGPAGASGKNLPQGEGQLASAGGGKGRTKGTGWDFDAGITAKMKI